jgi:hypothetical protein
MLKKELNIKHNSSLLIILLPVSFFFTAGSCNHVRSGNLEDKNPAFPVEADHPQQYPDNIKVRSYQNADSSWGFAIFLNGKLYIHQQVMPGIESITGFRTEKDAVKVAELVAGKIRKHITPAVVSKEEIDSLGI